MKPSWRGVARKERPTYYSWAGGWVGKRHATGFTHLRIADTGPSAVGSMQQVRSQVCAIGTCDARSRL